MDQFTTNVACGLDGKMVLKDNGNHNGTAGSQIDLCNCLRIETRD